MTISRLILLDSCSVVNLYASAHFESILTSLDGLVTILDVVLNESQFIRTPVENDDVEKERIRLDETMERKALTLLQLESETEFELFLELGLRLDDGEAATLAVAASRGGLLITDDRKALSIASELSVPTRTTPDVLHHWAHITGVPTPILRQALENIRWRARYEPNKQHPLWDWWRATIETGQTP